MLMMARIKSISTSGPFIIKKTCKVNREYQRNTSKMQEANVIQGRGLCYFDITNGLVMRCT
jgi:hypothetical protein